MNAAMKKVYDEEIGAITDALQEAIFISEVELNLDSSYIRLQEVRPISFQLHTFH